MNAPSLCAPAFGLSTPVLMQMVVEQQHVALLRQTVSKICRIEVEILFLKPCQAVLMQEHKLKEQMVKVCFLVSEHLINAVMDNIMQILPAAQFGRYHDVSDHLQTDVLKKLEQDYAPSEAQPLLHEHLCPVCQKLHRVNSAMHALSYGKPHTCSLACELQRRQHWWHFSPHPCLTKR